MRISRRTNRSRHSQRIPATVSVRDASSSLELRYFRGDSDQQKAGHRQQHGVQPERQHDARGEQHSGDRRTDQVLTDPLGGDQGGVGGFQLLVRDEPWHQ